MNEIAQILLSIWTAVLTHLWQTTLIVIPLLLLGRLLNRASSRHQEIYWSLLLGKLLVPLAVSAPLLAKLWHLLPVGTSPELAANVKPILQTAETVLAVGGKFVPAKFFTTPWGGAIVLLGTAIWLIGSMSITVRTVGALRDLARLHRSGQPAQNLPGPQRRRLFAESDRIGIPRRRLLTTNSTNMPAVAGLWRPYILLPVGLIDDLSPTELAAILHHENAHRRRRDPLRMVLRRLVLALFFFYPPLYFILRQIGESAEFAADERVLEAGIAPRHLARVLAQITRLYPHPEPLIAAVGSGGGSLLQRRLGRLNDPEKNTMMRFSLLIALAILLVGLGSFVPGTTGLATPSATAAVSKISVDEPAITSNPEIIHMAPPSYPEDALKAKAEGTVYIKVLVDRDGGVEKATIDRGVDGFPSLGEAALEAANACKFKPATRNGEPEKAWMMLPFTFRMS